MNSSEHSGASSALAVDACYALLWIHTHHQTGEPLQIDVTEWSGRVDVLEQLTDDAKIGDLDLAGLKREDWIHVRVEYSWEETEYSLRLFPPNIQTQTGGATPPPKGTQ